MSILYVVKEFGRYHYFKTVEERQTFVESLIDWEQKFVQTYEVRFGRVE